MADYAHRILGPNHNRLLVIGAQYRADKSLVQGTISLADANKLVVAGWTPYFGTAKAINGWVVPDSDPALRRRNTLAK